jgi:hypothetical protein
MTKIDDQIRNEVRELTTDELDAVAGGFLSQLIALAHPIELEVGPCTVTPVTGGSNGSNGSGGSNG